MSVDAKRLQAVFLAALEAPDRGALLDRECGADAELRQRVEKLLAAHEDSAPLPAAPPERTSDFVPIAERPGSMVGPYKLKEQIGEGGFGLVFVAEQTEPVKASTYHYRVTFKPEAIVPDIDLRTEGGSEP